MLETRMPPISPRTRRSPMSAQPVLRTHSDLRAEARLSQAQAAEEPPCRTRPSARSSRLSRSEMRLMGLATVSTAVVCALLLVYLAAYAHVTQLGIQQSQAQAQLHQNRVRGELLQAERNALESPHYVAAAAAAQGMSLRGSTPIDYVAARPVQSAFTQNGAGMASNGTQGSSSGTTEDSRTAASFDH